MTPRHSMPSSALSPLVDKANSGRRSRLASALMKCFSVGLGLLENAEGFAPTALECKNPPEWSSFTRVLSPVYTVPVRLFVHSSLDTQTVWSKEEHKECR